MAETKTLGKKIGVAVLITAIVTIVVIAIIIAVGYAMEYYEDSKYDDEVRAVMNKLPAAAYEQKEFPKSYMEWFAKYCVPENSGKYSKFNNKDQTIAYCACTVEKRVHLFTLKEQETAVQARWDPEIVPDSLKKHNDIKTECTEKVLSVK